MQNGKKPRVLFVYDFPIHGGGSGAYVKYLALRLVEKCGYKDRLGIVLPDSTLVDDKIKQYNLKLPQIPVFVGRPGLENQRRYSDLTAEEIADLYKAFIDGIIQAVQDFKPDIIHVHHVSVVSWAVRFIRSIFGTKYILTSHGSCTHAISKDRRYFRLSRDAVNAAATVTVVSGDSRSKLIKMFGPYISKRTRTIPGGIKLVDFPLTKNTDAIRKEYDLEGKKIALFTGRLISEKGVEYLVKAAKKIKGEILIAGDGPQKAVLEEMVAKLGLTNVKMLGFFADRTKIIDLYYMCDVFVSPAVWDEPLGLTTIEAMAASRPAVVTRKGGAIMAIKDGVNGRFVRPRNANEIARVVNELFDNPDLCKKMGTNARKNVEDKFTWTKIAEKFDQLYQNTFQPR